MGSALVYVVVVALVGAVVYLLAAFVFGRGEELAPMPPEATPTRLPARDLTGGDVRDLRFQQTLRGYKAGEVDWALERLAAEVDALRARLAVVDEARDGSVPTDTSAGRNGAYGTHQGDDQTPTDPSVRAPASSGVPGESSRAWRGMSGADGGDVPRRGG